MKDPEKRIDMIEIYEHPWMEKYRLKEEKWSDQGQSASEASGSSADSLDATPGAEGFDPESQDVNDDQDSNGSGSAIDHRDPDNGKVKKIHENNFLNNQFMFNIQENEDETTGNFVRVNLKPRKDTNNNNKGKLGGTMYANNSNNNQ